MEWQVCYCGEVVGEELGGLDDLLQLPGGNTTDHLHDEHSRSLSPAATASYKDQVFFPLTGGRTQATVPGNGRYHQEVDNADPELATGAQSVGDPL